MNLRPLDAPIHDLTDWEEFVTIHGRSPHAAGYLDGHPVTIRRLMTPTVDDFLYPPGYRVTLFGHGPRPLHADAPSFTAAVALVKAAIYYADPTVAFIIGGAGWAGLDEVLEAGA